MRSAQSYAPRWLPSDCRCYRSNPYRVRNFQGCEHEPDRKFRNPFCADGERQRPRQSRRVYSQSASQRAGVAEQNSQYALDMARKLSHQLRAAEQRITDLEAEVERHRDRAERAEQWLHKVYTEIEDRFLRQESGRARTMAR
jgi:hypothetical protein